MFEYKDIIHNLLIPIAANKKMALSLNKDVVAIQDSGVSISVTYNKVTISHGDSVTNTYNFSDGFKEEENIRAFNCLKNLVQSKSLVVALQELKNNLESVGDSSHE